MGKGIAFKSAARFRPVIEALYTVTVLKPDIHRYLNLSLGLILRGIEQHGDNDADISEGLSLVWVCWTGSCTKQQE
jgi:hypothetical protein